MADPVLHLLAGPNGAGKSTLYDAVVGPATHLEFVNADAIAAKRWPEDPEGRSYDAAAVAAELRSRRLRQRRSFATETVFSHESKLELLRAALGAGYLVTLHVVMVPEGLAVARVASRVAVAGHSVPEGKVRGRYRRLWPLIARAVPIVESAYFYDNTRIKPAFRRVATFERGTLIGSTGWPSWTPKPLLELTD
jgi:predicted ABC-type ATPase